MNIVPGFNCFNEVSFEKRLCELSLIMPRWIHLDVSDGKFTPVVTFNNPHAFEHYDIHGANVELHCMVDDPCVEIDRWKVIPSIKRFIVHIEAMQKHHISLDDLYRVSEGKEIGLTICPKTPFEDLFPFIDERIRFVMLLAVTPGFSGGLFQESVLDSVKVLHTQFSSLFIEVDGGVNEMVAQQLKRVGAHSVVSTSYLSGLPEVVKTRFTFLESL